MRQCNEYWYKARPRRLPGGAVQRPSRYFVGETSAANLGIRRRPHGHLICQTRTCTRWQTGQAITYLWKIQQGNGDSSGKRADIGLLPSCVTTDSKAKSRKHHNVGRGHPGANRGGLLCRSPSYRCEVRVPPQVHLFPFAAASALVKVAWQVRHFQTEGNGTAAQRRVNS